MNPAPPAIDSRQAFHAALAWGFASAMDAGARRIVCSDPDFSIWAWDEPSTLDALGRWLRLPQRSLVLLCRDYGSVPRCHPRFNRWRADWAHAIAAWQVSEEWPTALPTVLVADSAISVHLIDAVHWRGQASDDERDAHPWRQALDVVLQRSEPGFAVRTLGL